MRFLSREVSSMILAVGMLLPLTSAAQQNANQSTAVASLHTLQISSGDLLDVSVFDTPELSTKLRVNDAGDALMPVAGAVHLAGLTAEEAAVAIEGKLRSTEILRDPHVSVFITEYATQGITLAGEVKNPGIYPLLGSHNLLDLVAAAGGVTPTAGKAVTITHKSDPQHPEIVLIGTKPGSIVAPVDIRPGDTITVSRCGVVYVVGDVGKPGGYLIENSDRLTVLQAVALAQGTNRTAAQNKSRLIRKSREGREELPIPLKRILAGRNPDLPLEDGDILFIPSSEGKDLAYRGIEASIVMVTGMVTYGKL